MYKLFLLTRGHNDLMVTSTLDGLYIPKECIDSRIEVRSKIKGQMRFDSLEVTGTDCIYATGRPLTSYLKETFVSNEKSTVCKELKMV